MVLHSDNSSPMKVTTFQVLLEKLGIQSSYSKPGVNNDRPYWEVVFQMLKYRSDYLYSVFKTIDEARKLTPHQSVALNPLKETES